MINGTDQIKRNITQGIRKEPPPFCATTLENLQMLPVPTAIPSVAIMSAQREEKNSSCFKLNPLPNPSQRGGLSEEQTLKV